jgi:hypothetical protein
MRYPGSEDHSMNCHECARTHTVRTAVAVCRFCFVGLCKDHLVAAFHARTVPQYGCDHHPERALPLVVAAAPAAVVAQTPRAA